MSKLGVKPSSPPPENEFNCHVAGDACCDTPADPNLRFLYCNPTTCELPEVWVDEENILENWDPDMYNIMSYTHPNCANRFTSCQGAIMRCAIYEELLDLIVPIEDITISNHTVWDSYDDLPHYGDFIVDNNILIKSGGSLTIGSEIKVHFSQNAELIIEPNAILNLSGHLTSSDCNSTWKGIKVYGNSTQSQYSGPFNYHGYLRALNGSVIENAEIGAQLYGPEESDSGGKIYCTGATFLNNQMGVLCLPYKDVVDGKVRSYLGLFKLSDFIIDENFQFNRFDQHLVFSGVDGIRVSGCRFINERDFGGNDQFDYGFGVVAMDAGIKIGPAVIGMDNPGPCFPTACETIQKSQFKGLGYGVWAGTFLENKFVSVQESEFTDCYTGINLEGISGSTILFNKFQLGVVPDENVLDGHQIGIKLNNMMTGFTIEQDTFLGVSGNVTTIGILAENLGEENNLIRKNYFRNINIGNEAFGLNSTIDQPRGLRYVCNTNINIFNNDFQVSDDNSYQVNSINESQSDVSFNSLISAGNNFSSTGDPVDGDFANNGSTIENYHHHNSNGILDDYSGITNILPEAINGCANQYCPPPCIVGETLNDAIGAYYLKKSRFLYYSQYPNVDSQNIYGYYLDNYFRQILQYSLSDTIASNRDSVFAWFENLHSISGDIQYAKKLFKDHLSQQSFYLLDSIKFKRSATPEVEYDIEAIKKILVLSDTTNLNKLIPDLLDTLIEYAIQPGHSSSMAKNILLLNKEYFNIKLPYRSPPLPFVNPENNYDPIVNSISVYPNPVINGSFNVEISDFDAMSTYSIELCSIDGRKYNTNEIQNPNSIYNTSNFQPGLYIYMIFKSDMLIHSGKIVIFQN